MLRSKETNLQIRKYLNKKKKSKGWDAASKNTLKRALLQQFS